MGHIRLLAEGELGQVYDAKPIDARSGSADLAIVMANAA
jgi:hypothetical protein